MSCWIVSDDHIHLLVDAIVDLGHCNDTQKSRDSLGTMLKEMNYRSYNYRYDEDNVPPPYVYVPTDKTFTPGFIGKQASCYDYQSCEHDSYEGSDAEFFMRLICEATDYESKSTSELPWGIDDSHRPHKKPNPKERKMSTYHNAELAEQIAVGTIVIGDIDFDTDVERRKEKHKDGDTTVTNHILSLGGEEYVYVGVIDGKSAKSRRNSDFYRLKGQVEREQKEVEKAAA